MKKGTRVVVNLSETDAAKLGISKALENRTGTISGQFNNDVPGHFIDLDENPPRTVAIADKYNATHLGIDVT